MATTVTVQTDLRPATITVADADGEATIHPPMHETIAPRSTRTLSVYGSMQVTVTEVANAAPISAPADAPGEE